MQVKRALLIGSAALLVPLLSPHAFAQTSKSSTNATPAGTTTKPAAKVMSDSSFARVADEGGLDQVKLGQLAENKGASQTVRDFGKRMINDHTKADDQLKIAAAQDKITLPTNVTEQEKATYDRLSKLSGVAFDRAYARDMVRDHENDLAIYQREAKDGKDASIKNFASQTMPMLQDHLKLARQMQQTVSSEAGTSTKKQSS